MRFFRTHRPNTPTAPSWQGEIDEVLDHDYGIPAELTPSLIVRGMKDVCSELIIKNKLPRFDLVQEHLLEREAAVLLIAQPYEHRRTLLKICVEYNPPEPLGPPKLGKPPEFWLDIKPADLVMKQLRAFAITKEEHTDRLANKTGVLLTVPYYD